MNKITRDMLNKEISDLKRRRSSLGNEITQFQKEIDGMRDTFGQLNDSIILIEEDLKRGK